MNTEITTEELNEQFVLFLTRIALGDCVDCGAKVARFVQVQRSYYAEPCGHRQGQGSAKYFNGRLAERAAQAGGEDVRE